MITGKAWDDVNTLLSFLRAGTGFDVVSLVDAHFEKYTNDAPAWLLREQIKIVQAHLDRAREVPCDVGPSG